MTTEKIERPQKNAREGDPFHSPSPFHSHGARRRVWICINGILTNPGDSEGWTDRAVTWLHLRTGDQAEKFEYAAGALTRRLRQGWRAEAIGRMGRYYLRAGYDLSFIAHSNGADLVERVLPLLDLRPLYPEARVRSIHLFAPACDGLVLSELLQFERSVGSLHLYGSSNDLPLRFAAMTQAVLGWAGLGYGDLGRRVDDFAETDRTWIHRDDTQGHGTWFARKEPFERTMTLLLQHEALRAAL